jgi:hypothetical protein
MVAAVQDKLSHKVPQCPALAKHHSNAADAVKASGVGM